MKYAFYAMIPHMDDDDLDPYEYRLLGHYRRVCGVNGNICTQSTRTLAEKTKMSTGKVTQARQSLAAKGRINLAYTKKTIRVTLIDRWQENIERYQEKEKWSNTSQKSVRSADNLLNAFLRGDVLNGVWNAQQFEASMSALLMYLATVLPNVQLLKESLVKNAENPERFFTTLSPFIKEAGLECTICNSYAKFATIKSIQQSLADSLLKITRSPGEHVHEPAKSVHHMNANSEKCSPGETKKNLKEESIKEQQSLSGIQVTSIGQIVDIYQRVVKPGKIPKTIQEQLHTVCYTYSAQWVYDALVLSEGKGDPWKYMEAILKNWKERGRGQSKGQPPNVTEMPKPDYHKRYVHVPPPEMTPEEREAAQAAQKRGRAMFDAVVRASEERKRQEERHGFSPMAMNSQDSAI